MKKISLIKSAVLLGGLLFCLSACLKEDFSLTRGDVSGNATPEGVKITFDRGNKKFTVLSDAEGDYILHDLETGIYNVTFEKKGLMSYKIFGFQYFGGKSMVTMPSVSLDPEITANLDLQSVLPAKNHSLEISGVYKLNNDTVYTSSEYILWIMGTKPGVTIDNCLQKSYEGFSRTNELFRSSIQVDEKLLGGSSTIYIKGYIRASWYDYRDWEKQTRIYAVGKKESNEVKIQVPSNFFNQ